MSTFSIYIAVVITSVFFIFSSSSSTSRQEYVDQKARHMSIELEYTQKKLEDEKKYLEMQKLARAKVMQDLRKMEAKKRGLDIESIGKDFDGSLLLIPGMQYYPRVSPVAENLEILTENESSVVEETQQASLTEAAETFNRKCLEIETLLKEK